MKHRPGKNSSELIPALLAFLILALTLTSCAPKQKPFDLEEVETLRPPSNVRVIPAGQLEGVKVSVSWRPSPDDRYFTGIIAPRPVPGQSRDPRTKYEVKTFDDRPRDSRTKYEIYRAVVKPGEDIYSLPSDRFTKVGEVDEGEYQFLDEHTTPRRLWWQAKRREVEKIPRTMQESKKEPGTLENTEQTKLELKTWAGKGFRQDISENNRNYIILHKVTESEKMPVSFNADGKPDEETQKALMEMLDEGWEIKRFTGKDFILGRALAHEPELSEGVNYVYKVRFIYGENPDGSPRYADSASSLPVTSTSGLFRFDRLVNLILVITFVVVAGYFIFSARRGKEMYIRPIAGIAAVEEAVGRATEMGRPALFVPGIGAIAGPATLASMAILSKIAEKTAQYDTDLMVPNFNIFVLQVAQETIKEAYLKAGRPDAYNSDMAFFMSDRQFAYAAGISGIIARRRPAAIFLLGTFYAESLLLAEAGANIGAIQIAGTDMDHQLPFFITACDYTLIGEELYAAGAYLSRDPKLLGTLKGQDYFKAIVVILTVITVPLVIVLMATGVLNIGTFLKFFFDSEFILP
jgi:hypothetical protein